MNASTSQSRALLTFEAANFLYKEAALLDNREYDAWLDLLTEDIHYWMPIRRTTYTRDAVEEFTQPGDIAFFDDDLGFLKLRVARLKVGSAWAEDPPSRTRHFVSNVHILDEVGDELEVGCNFHLYRTRLESEEDSWFGSRKDLLRRVNGEFKLARRHIFLDQTTLLSQNLSSLF